MLTFVLIAIVSIMVAKEKVDAHEGASGAVVGRIVIMLDYCKIRIQYSPYSTHHMS